jgi:hemoglobin
MRHAPFVIGERERDAWVQNMLDAMDEAKIPEPAYTTIEFMHNKGNMLNLPIG